MTRREGPREEEKVFMDELERLKRQEKEAYEEAEASRKEFETKKLRTWLHKNTASPHEGLSLSDPTNLEEDDSEIPLLEDIYQNSTDGIFTTSSYDDEGAVADFTNLETVVNVSPIPTSRIHSSHPSALILGDPTSAVQTRSKVNTSSGAHAFVSYVQKQKRNNHKDFQHCLFACFLSQNEPKKISKELEDESWVDAMQEELLQFKTKKIVNLFFFLGLSKILPYGKMLSVQSGLYRNKKDNRGLLSEIKQEILKKFDFANVKTASTPIETSRKPLVKDEEARDVGCPFSIVTPKSLPSKVLSREFLGAKNLTLMTMEADPTNQGHFKWQITSILHVPLEHFPLNTLTSKVFSFMVKKGKHFSGKITPLFASMLVQPTEDESAPSERPSEAQPTPSPAHTSEVPIEPQTDLSPAHTSEVPIEQHTDRSPRPSPSTIILDSIPESSGGNLGGHSSSDKSLSGNEGEMTLQSVYDLCLSLCAQVSDQAKEIQHLKAQIKKLKNQAKPVIKHHRARMHNGRNFAKGESLVQRDPLFDELDHMETENAQDVRRTRDIVGEEKENDKDVLSTEDVLSTKDVLSTDKEKVSTNKEKVSTDKEKVSTDRPIVSTDGSKVSTDKQIEGTDEQIKGTDEERKDIDDHSEEGSGTQTTQTPTSTIFRDDETIAKVLLSMSQAKVVSREKEKGVELKDIEETDRPRPTSTRSLLTLKPLLKIDPKDKGKKKIEEGDETNSESDGIPEFEKKFKQLTSDEEMARKIQEEWKGEEERNKLAEEKATNEAIIRNYDDIKERIEADRLLAKKLQEEE
ncbi:hypothetical protein Tco_0413234, partial [Tanacetum coccineum]